MIAVLEVHDSTGWSEQTTAVPISNAVAYWTSSDIRAAINGQENFVIINIANEPFGNTTTANYLPDTIAAIQALRTAGLTHTIMIDGADLGPGLVQHHAHQRHAVVECRLASQFAVQRAHVRGVSNVRADHRLHAGLR